MAETAQSYIAGRMRKSHNRADMIVGSTDTPVLRRVTATVRQWTGFGAHTDIPASCSVVAEASTGYIPVVSLLEIAALREENLLLRAEIQRLKTATVAPDEGPDARTSAEVGSMADDRQQIVDKELAKQAILNALAVGDVFTYSDLLDKLNIDLELLVEACDSLAQEGKIDEARPAA